jgi:hypothetical protein
LFESMNKGCWDVLHRTMFGHSRAAFYGSLCSKAKADQYTWLISTSHFVYRIDRRVLLTSLALPRASCFRMLLIAG